jgi:hypothetical protein
LALAFLTLALTLALLLFVRAFFLLASSFSFKTTLLTCFCAAPLGLLLFLFQLALAFLTFAPPARDRVIILCNSAGTRTSARANRE